MKIVRKNAVLCVMEYWVGIIRCNIVSAENRKKHAGSESRIYWGKRGITEKRKIKRRNMLLRSVYSVWV